MDYPWLASSRAQFTRLSAQLPHALLIHGEEGLAKHALAMEIVASLLCDNAVLSASNLKACGACKNCVMFASANHPDFHYLSSEHFIDGGESFQLNYAQRYFEALEKRNKRNLRKAITVAQIRALIDQYSLSTHSAPYKVALIEPAEAMNINAANALLKLLEEPSPDGILILVCNNPSRLPMTIRSRCIKLGVEMPDFQQAATWLGSQGVDDLVAQQALSLAVGVPITALSYSQSEDIAHFEVMLETLTAILRNSADVIESRVILLKLQSPPILLDWLQMVMSWLISAGSREELAGEHPWQAWKRPFSGLSRAIGPSSRMELFQLYDDLLATKRQDLAVINIALLLDKWLISFARSLKPKAGGY